MIKIDEQLFNRRLQAERAVGYARGQEHHWEGDAAGKWAIRVDLSGLGKEDPQPAYPVKGDGWDSIRRAARRGYAVGTSD